MLDHSSMHKKTNDIRYFFHRKYRKKRCPDELAGATETAAKALLPQLHLQAGKAKRIATKSMLLPRIAPSLRPRTRGTIDSRIAALTQQQLQPQQRQEAKT